MKFRFCGEADCPDWVLAQINILSRISSIKLKSLAQIVAKGIVNPPVNLSSAEKLFSDSKLDGDIDLKTCIACISFLLTSTVQYNCNSTALHSELQQLGLPREHSTSIKRVVDDQYNDLMNYFKLNSFKVHPLKEANIEWEGNDNYISIELVIDEQMEKVTILPNTLEKLLADLKKVHSKITLLNDNSTFFF